MKASIILTVSIFSILLLSVPLAISCPNSEKFLQCLSNHVQSSSPIYESIYTPKNSSFNFVLQAYIKNRRFLTPDTPKPLVIIAARDVSQVQSTVLCAKSHGLQLRIRSGGHDFEGLSYRSNVPFVILDLFNYRDIQIDIRNQTAWVQSGATLGELYYNIANRSRVHAFPAGVCPTVGTGGHFSGGGYGNLMRKYGLSVDNIIDAQIVDVNGKILNRESMGEDLFWAIRGGGGASFGVILAWKINLVQIPETVTVFNVSRTLEQGATDLVYSWQQVASELDKKLFIRVMPQIHSGSHPGEKTIRVDFIGEFLGRSNELLPLMNKSFPELGLHQQDCHEMSWIESTVFWAAIPNRTDIGILVERPNHTIFHSKVKSDYVKDIIPKEALEIIWKNMIKVGKMLMEWNPFGGRMGEISATETPFPYRSGYLFMILHYGLWKEEGLETTNHYIKLMREYYETLTPYVTKNPREAFSNYRDLDIGSNTSNYTSFERAAVYGHKYFKNNFEKLTFVKGRVDPDNFFKYEQSIPPLILLDQTQG